MAAGLRALASEVAAVAARLQSLQAATLCSALPAASHHLQHIPWHPCIRLAASNGLHAAGRPLARPLSVHAALAEEEWQEAADGSHPGSHLYERLPDHVPEAPLEAAALAGAHPTATPAPAATTHAAVAALPSDGDVQYPEGTLLQRMREHYAALQATYPGYTERVSWDAFGARYLEQIRREEDARNRAWATQQAVAAKDLAAGRSGQRRGSIATKLVQAWIPRLTEAIEAEQQQVRAGAWSGSADRINYGPYLLMVPAEDLAVMTVQTVLGRVATTSAEQHAGGGAMGAPSSSTGRGGSSSSRPGDSSSPEPGSVPAAMMVEQLGRAANDRLKYLAFKHALVTQQAALKAERRAAHETARKAAAAAAAAAAGQIHTGEHLTPDTLTFSGVDAAAHAGLPSAGTSTLTTLDTSSSSSTAGSGGGNMEAIGPLTAASWASYQAAGEAASKKYAAQMALLAGLAAAVSKQHKKGSRLQRVINAATAGQRWDHSVQLKVGALLLSLLVENATLLSQGGRGGGRGAGGRRAYTPVPAFLYEMHNAGLRSQGFVCASGPLLEALSADQALLASVAAKAPPMLVPPLPWTSYNRGGYLTQRHWMMRTRWSWHVKEALVAGARRQGGGGGGEGGCQYQEVLDALNVLGNTPWRINPRVYQAMSQLWQGRSTAGGLPRQDPARKPRPPATGYRLICEGGTMVARGGPPTRGERRLYQLRCEAVRRANRNMASLVADFKLKFNVAKEFLDAPELYYPHTLDFRGRAYPIHPSLQHLGDDACRGLLVFGQGRPLGPRGLDWLYVHLANTWGGGVDKLPYDERRRFTREHLPQVLAVAQDPVENGWWSGAEKPWQCLAACCEVAAALASVEPQRYISHLPVHMDGSCNGLQHYAALGRDSEGGAAVNLLDAPAPRDVYKGVAAIVGQRVEADAETGHPWGGRCRGLVDRKLVKQTVMTSVYGVTHIGARQQIENRLRERGAFGGDRDQQWGAAKYLADHTLEAIAEMFSAARGIMDWLADCARVVASSGAPMKWTTPLGLPIAQPYHQTASHQVATLAQNFTVLKDSSDQNAPVTKSRQRSAFPPNYIHSIDSTHMMMTALRCAQEGLLFAGVHDSYWTHAGTVERMNVLLREEFVRLHTQHALLEDLLAQLTAAHPGLVFQEVPARGELQVERVKNSKYFFS